MGQRFVDREYFIEKIDGVLSFLRGELLKCKPWWCPAFIYLWWCKEKGKRLNKREVKDDS